MKTLIVDDEPIARRVLREALELLPGVEVVGEADNGRSAVEQIEKLRPELGLSRPADARDERLRGGAQPRREAHAHHRHRDRLRPARGAGVRGRRRRLSAEARAGRAPATGGGTRPRHAPPGLSRSPTTTARIAAAAAPAAPAPGRKIVARSGADYVLLDTGEVLAFQAERELVWIITAKQRLLATQPLCGIEQRLPPANFSGSIAMPWSM
jgi:DNA-binding LytR/AlgR family response regulator